MGLILEAGFNGDSTVAGFPDLWLWLVFLIVGLVLVLLELIVGVETGLDLVFVGSAFIIGGLATWPSHSWLLTVIVTSAICVAYVALGRRYVHRWTQVKKQKRTSMPSLADEELCCGTLPETLTVWSRLAMSGGEPGQKRTSRMGTK